MCSSSFIGRAGTHDDLNHAPTSPWRNCLTFANELCELLGAGRLPAWIDRFARGAGAAPGGEAAWVRTGR